MRRIALLLLLLAAPAWGQPDLTIPPEVRPSGQYAQFTPNTDAVSVVYVGLSGVDAVPSTLLRDPTTFLLDTRGLREGRYQFAAVGADASGLQARVDFAVIVGTPGPIPPDPDDPDPPPLPPDDPLVMALTEAYKACPESDKRALVQKFAALHREAIPYLNTDKTIGALFNRMERGAKTLGLAGKIQPIQEMVAAHLLSLLPDPVATPNAGYDPAKATAAFSQIADALEEVAR